MSKSRELGELGQLITVNTTSVSVGNTVMHTSGITVGNTSIHSNGVSIGGESINNTSYPGTANNANNLNGVPASSYVNTSGSYTISGVHTHNANIVIGAGVSLQANGTVGDAGQSLVSNGSSVYWTTAGATLNANNTDSQAFYIGLSNSSTGAWTNAVVATSKLNFIPSTGTLTVDSATVNATNYSGTANNTLYVGSVTAANVVSNAQLQANVSTLQGQITSNASAAYTNATVFASNASNVNTGTLAEARLPYRLNQNVRNTDSVTFNGMTLTGNLVVSGNVNIIGANNLSLVDNMIYLNANSTVTNPDLGIAGNYNDGTYRHTGFFRDATDGFWKVYDNYGPEPDASPYIDTSNSTFRIANFWANTIYVGNTSVYATVNTTNFTGTANNASYLGGTAAASYALLSGATFSGDVRSYRSASTGTGVYYFSQSGDYYLYWNGSNFTLNGGYTYATGSMRSPLFYDSDNTGYYFDGASTTNVNAMKSYSYQGNGNVGGTGDAAWFPSGLYSASGAQCWIYGDINRGGAATTNGGAYYGTIFYDNNDSGYYTDPNDTSRVKNLIVGGHGGTAYDTAMTGRLWMGTNADGNYSIYTGMESFNGNYTKLTLDWHTGIRIGAYSTYGGIRFYNNSVNAGGTKIFSVGEGDNHVRVENNLYAPILYDYNDTGYYVNPNSLSIFNTIRSADNWWQDGGGNNRMLWVYGDHNYYRSWNYHVFRNSSNTDVHYIAGDGNVWMGTYKDWLSTQIRSGIFYDHNDTYYYEDPNSSRRLAGRTYIHEWIEFVNYTGLYSPNNAAHMKPNDGSYGAWKITGSRNGWGGIEFDAGSTTLMMNDDSYGFHRNAGGGWRFYCSSGSGHFPGNVVAYWSDRRLKENLRPIGKESIQILNNLTAYRFNWNYKVEDFFTDLKPGKEEIGLIAQEVQEILPDAVVINKSANISRPDGTEEQSEYLTINWNKITPIVVQALNETVKELNELKQLLKDKGII